MTTPRTLLFTSFLFLFLCSLSVYSKGIFDDLIKDIGKTAGDAFEESMKEAEDKKKGLVALKLLWSEKRQDNYVTTTSSEGKAMYDGYKKVRVEGLMLIKQATGTLPLKTYYNAKFDDYTVVATPEMEEQVKQDGYKLIRTEGYIFPIELPGTIPLKLYWNQERTDFHPAAAEQSIRDAEANNYKFLRIEGYLLRESGNAIPAVPKDALPMVQPTNFNEVTKTTPVVPTIPVVTEQIATTPLKLFWNAGKQDNYTTTPAGEENAKKDGYGDIRVEGYLRARPFAGALALKTYYSAKNEDYVSIATQDMETKVKQDGYTYIRTEGFVYPTQQPGTTPLKLYWNVERTDYQNAASKDGINDAEIWEYKFVSIEGYILTDSKITTPTPVQESSPNIIAKYNFDETGGNIVNDKVGKVNGTLYGDAAFVAGGVSGNCIKMSRNGKGFVNFGDNLMMSKSNFTISIWVKTAPGMRDGESWVITKHRTGYENGYWMMLNGTTIKSKEDKVTFFAGSNNTVVSTTTVNDGKWHYIVGVYYMNGNEEIYVDGVPVEEKQGSVQIRENNSPLLIGSCDYGSALTGGFNGMVDELAIYNVALTEAEIDKLYTGVTVQSQDTTSTQSPVTTTPTTTPNPPVNTDTTKPPVTLPEIPIVSINDSEQAIYNMLTSLRQACDKKDIEKTCSYFDMPIRKKIKDFLMGYPDQMKVLSDALKNAKITDVNDERDTDGFAEIKMGTGEKTVYMQLISHDKNWFIKSL